MLLISFKSQHSSVRYAECSSHQAPYPHVATSHLSSKSSSHIHQTSPIIITQSSQDCV